ncbi:MAG TPA: GNAT family N-acetyltransferase [Burkholderiales bacterium]
MLELLDNIVWHSLAGPHRRFAEGDDRVLRYQGDVTSLVGFPVPESPDFDALRPYCRSSERLYCLGWQGAMPRGWNLEVETTIVKMAWDAAMPKGGAAVEPVRLDATHVADAQALAAATNPGPFGSRTIEMGEYFGYLFEGRLVAMAGERMQAGNLHEVSAVCVHPEYQGKGLAREIMFHVIRRQLHRGETPFLHVLKHNERAVRMYERMGFRIHREMPVRVVSLA